MTQFYKSEWGLFLFSLLTFSVTAFARSVPGIACDNESPWICFERALKIEQEATSGLRLACPIPSAIVNKLPPIVIPPVIASFDPFARALANPTLNPLDWDPILGFGTACGFDLLSYRLMEVYQRACKEGVSGSCSKVVVSGGGGFVRGDEFVEALSRSCLTEDPKNCSAAAAAVALKDKPRSLALVSHGCHERDPASCREVGFQVKITGDENRANQWWEQACEDGDAEACALRANGENALRWHEKACRMGFPGQCDSALALFAASGQQSEAELMCSAACKQNQWKCCGYLGDKAVERGHSVEAVPLYREACNESLKACYAWAYYAGEAFAKEHGEEALKETCSDFGGIACLAIAVRQIKAKRFNAQSFPLVDRGCETGNAESCYFLASFFQDSHRPQARHYFKKACQLGISSACLLADSKETEPIAPEVNIFQFATFRIHKMRMR